MHTFENTLIHIPEHESEFETAFKTIEAQARTIQANTTDYIVPVGTVEIIDRNNICFLADDELTAMDFSKNTLAQISKMTHVPYNYLTYLLESHRENDEEIFKLNLNNGLHNLVSKIEEGQKNGKRVSESILVRTYKDIIRAVLSTQYSPYDQDKILRELNIAMNDASIVKKDDFIIKCYIVSPENFHIKMFNKNIIKINGRKMQCGMEINSADIGNSMLTMNFCIYDVATGSVITFNANGHTAEAKRNHMEQIHKNVNSRTIENKFHSAFAEFETVSKRTINALEKAAQHKISLEKIFQDEKSPLKQIFASKIGLSLEELNKIKDQLCQQHDLFSFACRLAEYAKTKPAYDRIKLEHIAGSVINRTIGIDFF